MAGRLQTIVDAAVSLTAEGAEAYIRFSDGLRARVALFADPEDAAHATMREVLRWAERHSDTRWQVHERTVLEPNPADGGRFVAVKHMALLPRL